MLGGRTRSARHNAEAPRDAGSPERAVVVGAGIAGLAAGYRLRQAGFSVTVLEAEDHVGGRMSTVALDGYRIDTGASLLSSAYRQMVQLIEAAGLASSVEPTSSTFGVLRDGRVHRMSSDSAIDGVRTKLLSARAKASATKLLVDVIHSRAQLDYADLSKAADLDTETLRDYAQRRVNPEVLDFLIEPITVGSFGIPSDQLSKVGFMFIIKNFIFGGSFFNSPTGIDFLPKGLARELDTVLGARVTEVEETTDGVQVRWRATATDTSHVEPAAVAVIAVPAPTMLEIYPQLDSTRREITQSIEYCRSITVALGLSRRPTETCAMLLIPPREHPDVLAVFLEHNKAPGRAPAGKGLVSLDWQGAWSDQRWEDDDETIAADTETALRNALPGTLDDCNVELTHVTRWSYCLTRGQLGFYRDLKRFNDATDPDSAIQLAGDYLGLSSTGSSLCSGEQAADRLISRARRDSRRG